LEVIKLTACVGIGIIIAARARLRLVGRLWHRLSRYLAGERGGGEEGSR